MAASLGPTPVFATCTEMLARCAPDMMIVGTPPDFHAEVTEMALRSGVHVLCEKPFMPTIEEADRAIELARGSNLLLRVNNQYRFMTIYRETKAPPARGRVPGAFAVNAGNRWIIRLRKRPTGEAC